MPRALVELFARRLRELRESAGLTQEGLAARCGLNRTHVYFLEQEHRSPKLETIEKLARGLGVQPRDLLPDLPHPVSKRRAK
ncbi:MAG TPA: helix-turn-helix transcriptional regulator [Tepidisphaeraceae bacterium]